MRDKDVLLELISVDVPEQDAQATEAKASNRKMLDVLTAEVRFMQAREQHSRTVVAMLIALMRM